MKSFLFIGVVLAAFNANAALTCDAASICTIPQILKTESGETVEGTYKFKYRAPKGDSPVLVYLPGGPGGTSVDKDFSSVTGIPDDYGVILTDPRFAGVNERADAVRFKKEISSEGVARDVIAALKAVEATKYVVYGVSYGTVPATIIGAQAESQGLPRAIAVILDGTVGRTILRGEYEQGFIRQWEEILKDVGSGTAARFTAGAQQLINEGLITSERLGGVIMLLTLVRNIEGKPWLYNFVPHVAMDPKGALPLILALDKASTQMHDELVSPFRMEVSCREMFPYTAVQKSSFRFTDKLEATGTIECADSYFTEPFPRYDSAKYQSLAPLIYLQGFHDPATTMEQMTYHAGAQKSAPKKLVLAPDGGHALLSNDLAKCAEGFWKSLPTDQAAAVRAFDACLVSPRASAK